MFKWAYSLAAKGGQDIKEKKDGSTVAKNKATDFVLSIKAASDSGGGVEGLMQSLASEIDGIDTVVISLSGKKESLEEVLRTAAKVISEEGGQQTLDNILGEKIKA